MTRWLLWPVDSGVITQRFGANPDRYPMFNPPGHEGIDFRAPEGANIYCCADGAVRSVNRDVTHPYGNHVRVDHEGGYQTVYAHLSAIAPRIAPGEPVYMGQVLGYAGSTGNSTGPHLHLTLKRNGIIVNPTNHLAPIGTHPMGSSIGINVLAQFAADRARMMNWLTRAKPRLVVVMDAPDVAAAAKSVLPDAAVVHRWYRPDDASLHHTMTAEQFVQTYLNALPPGVIAQVLNEPQGYADLRPLAKWCAAVMRLAALRDQRVAVPNFAVGHPDEARIAAGELDDLLRAFGQHPGHFLAMHEYFQNTPASEQPHHIGRYRHLLNRARQLGVNPRVLITEAGRDVGGAVHHGWRAVMDEATYVQRLWEQADSYKADGISMAVFCYGGSGGQWRNFDIESAETVLNAIATYNTSGDEMSQTIKPPAETTYTDGQVTAVPSGFVNIRSMPSVTAADLGDIFPGDTLQYADVAAYPDWWHVRWRGIEGWVNKLGGKVKIEPAAALPPALTSPWLTKDEIQQLAEHHERIAAILRAAVARAGA